MLDAYFRVELLATRWAFSPSKSLSSLSLTEMATSVLASPYFLR
jgi:hypothetical protein